jgi:peptide deformylase
VWTPNPASSADFVNIYLIGAHYPIVMTILPVRMLGEPILRNVSGMVDTDYSSLDQHISDMKDTLRHLQREKGIGRAIAAPQVGISKRIIVVETPDVSLVLVNPQIIEKSDEWMALWDTCYSFDTVFFVRVHRHRWIRVRWQDQEGGTHEEIFRDGMSALLQHEIDHLNGILAIDRMECDEPNGPDDLGETIIMRSVWEELFRE